jgi:hypothetical protein
MKPQIDPNETESEREAREAKERHEQSKEQEEKQEAKLQSTEDTAVDAAAADQALVDKPAEAYSQPVADPAAPAPTTPYPGDPGSGPATAPAQPANTNPVTGEGTTAKSAPELRGGIDKVDDGNNKVQGSAQKPAVPGARGVERHVQGPTGWVYEKPGDRPVEVDPGKQKVEDTVPISAESQAEIDKEKSVREEAEKKLIEKSKAEVPQLVKERDEAAAKAGVLPAANPSAAADANTGDKK